MPAQSPTLSPTLSAMVAGLRGSSSGMPASTLPTRSAPTSAPLVKMPPPRRAKIEISEAPKPSATSAVDDDAARRAAGPADRSGSQIVDRDAEQREAGDQHAGDGARLEGDVEAGGERLLDAACAVRTLARTETFMPMKPAAPDRIAPIRKPIATVTESSHQASTKTTTPTMAIVMYWRRR